MLFMIHVPIQAYNVNIIIMKQILIIREFVNVKKSAKKKMVPVVKYLL